MSNHDPSPITRRQFKEMVCHPGFHSIDGDKRFHNLATGYWVYDELLSNLRQSGWVRIAPGFKAGVYCRSGEGYCIKILGMGVGDNPLYFCERGYYLEHERNMLADFQSQGFNFGPKVLSPEATVRFLTDKCGVNPTQAEIRTLNNDLLIMEYISGVPFATQTGHFLNYNVHITAFDDDVLSGFVSALKRLKSELECANTQNLLHNDPMPPNIIFSIGEGNEIVARLVDFELAQNLDKSSPEFVNNSVAELYAEREVPQNAYTKKFKKNLDQHLMDESILVATQIVPMAKHVRALDRLIDATSITIPFLGGIGIDLGQARKIFQR
jgi:serine/threonine protein kinase